MSLLKIPTRMAALALASVCAFPGSETRALAQEASPDHPDHPDHLVHLDLGAAVREALDNSSQVKAAEAQADHAKWK
ncbi:hypothetical protein EBZ80_02725 [bacterium]|nr:hypothetical protein [bacterium]